MITLGDETTSTVTIIPQVTLSSPPIDGRYRINCPDPLGNDFITRSFGYWDWVEGVNYYLHLDVPHLNFKVRVLNEPKPTKY